MSNLHNKLQSQESRDFKKVKRKTHTPYLEKFATNFTKKVARDLESYRAIGRDEEIIDVIYSLNRMKKKSPILVGDPGVGKTAIVEGLCVAINEGTLPNGHPLPDVLKNKQVYSVNLSALQSRTINERGEEEGSQIKLRNIVKEAAKYIDEIIIFIDEVHTIMNPNFGVADDVFKEPLSRAEINFIGATTQDEYVIIIKDPAMERRLPAIFVDEVSRDNAVKIMKAISENYTRKRGVTITDEAVEGSVDLSIRFISDRYLPDKAIDLIDEAEAVAQLDGKETVTLIDIARVIHKRMEIPLERIIRVSSSKPIDFEQKIGEVVKGQPILLRDVARVVYNGLMGLNDERKPLASVFVLGTSGTGKTETFRQLAIELFGTADALIRLDMSEFSEGDAVTRLIGGIGEEGVLTKQVRKKPYSIILFDEIEKADPKTHNLMLQILDVGHLQDGRGKTIQFKNTVIAGTTNAGHRRIISKYATTGNAGFSTLDPQSWKTFLANIQRDLLKIFRPEFLNRWEVKTVTNMLDENTIREIVSSQMAVLEKTLYIKQHVSLEFFRDGVDGDGREAIYDFFKNIGTDVANGARPLENTIREHLSSPISRQLYFMRNRKPDDYFKATVVLKGTPPRSIRDSDGRETVIDKRYLDIVVNKVP